MYETMKMGFDWATGHVGNVPGPVWGAVAMFCMWAFNRYRNRKATAQVSNQHRLGQMILDALAFPEQWKKEGSNTISNASKGVKLTFSVDHVGNIPWSSEPCTIQVRNELGNTEQATKHLPSKLVSKIDAKGSALYYQLKYAESEQKAGEFLSASAKPASGAV